MSLPTKPTTRSTYRPPNAAYSLETRKLAVHNVAAGIWTPKDVKEKVGCSPTSFKRWRYNIKNNIQMYDESHCPSYVSPAHQKAVMAQVDEKSKNGVYFSKRKFSQVLQDASNKTRNEENKKPVKLKPGYLQTFIKTHGIKEANAEVIDNAHDVATGDPRHAASFASMIHYIHTKVPRGLFINIDKTSFDTKKAEQENAAAVFTGTRPQCMKCDDPYPDGSQGNCSVHVFVVANDTGKLADMVYLVKDNLVPAGQIDAYMAPMLDCSTNAAATTHLLFIGDSLPNQDAALNWLLENVFVPFLTQLRTRLDPQAAKHASLTVDGDPRQLQVMAQPGIVSMCTGSKIILSKSPASCTPLFQPLDAGKLFLAAKTRFRASIAGGVVPGSKEDALALKVLFREHRQKYPKKYKQKGLPSEEMGKYFSDVMACLLHAADALRKSSLSSIVMDSFKVTGVSPFNLSAIRAHCSYKWQPGDEQRFDEAVPALAAIFGRNFELKEEDLEKAGIPATQSSRDVLPVHRRRALLIHAPHILADLAEQAAKKAKK